MKCSDCGTVEARKWVRGKCVRCYQRAYHKEYDARPEQKSKRVARESKPEVRARKKEYLREWARRPDVREKKRVWARDWRQKPDVKQRRRLERYRDEYGLTVEEYAAMLAAQGGSCAICRVPFVEEDDRKKARVDHDHRTGKVRGLLCDGCNTSIGRLGDTAEALINAAEYLVRFEEKQRDSTS